MKIDENYAVSKKWKGRNYLPFIIEQAPKEYSLNDLKENTYATFNDERLVLRLPSDKAGDTIVSKMLLYGATLFFALMLFQNLLSEDASLNVIAIYFMVSCIPAFLGLRLKIKTKSMPDNEYVIFHRLLGIIELPSVIQGESIAIRFHDLKALHTSFTTTIYYSGKIIAFIRDASPYTISKFLKVFFGRFTYDWIEMSWSKNPVEYWSFYVWYMDRNRPLPPGSAFDAYRQKDYERRKAEGFPPPLYESKIPTPELVMNIGASMLDNMN